MIVLLVLIHLHEGIYVSWTEKQYWFLLFPRLPFSEAHVTLVPGGQTISLIYGLDISLNY